MSLNQITMFTKKIKEAAALANAEHILSNECNIFIYVLIGGMQSHAITDQKATDDTCKTLISFHHHRATDRMQLHILTTAL